MVVTLGRGDHLAARVRTPIRGSDIDGAAARAPTEDRLLGALLGTALGDALGAPFEGRRAVSASQLDALVGADTLLRWTDDTHMAMALAGSLLACGDTVNPQHLGASFAAAYHDQPWRGYAGGPPRVFELADRGATYEAAARSPCQGGSFGNGGAMRCAPVAIIAHPDVALAARLAAAQARVTHAHPLDAIAERVHALVARLAPHLRARSWYGMPAYADGKEIVCFFQAASKFEARYATLGFNDVARLDDGDMWPVAFAILGWRDAVEARVEALLEGAVS